MKHLKYFTAFSIFSLFMGLLGQSSAQAITVSDSNNFVDLGDSGDVTQGANESDSEIFFFREGTSTVSDLSVDATTSGTYDKNSDRTTGTLNGNFNSFYFSFDPLGTPSNAETIGESQGGSYSVTFNQDIKALIFTDDENSNVVEYLDDSDSQLADNNSTYPDRTDTKFRGLEGTFDDNNDVVTWENDNRTLTFNKLRAGNEGVDQVRVVTEPAPFEAEGTMGLVALGGYFFYRHRKKRKQVLNQ